VWVGDLPQRGIRHDPCSSGILVHCARVSLEQAKKALAIKKVRNKAVLFAASRIPTF